MMFVLLCTQAMTIQTVAVPPTPLFGEFLPERRSGVIRVHTRALVLV